MNLSILIPHFKNGKSTAYCISQLLKHKGNHSIEIIVISNSRHEGVEYIKPFEKDITLIYYPSDLLQSHGVSFDFAIKAGLVKNEYFITLESDSFPENDLWLDYYEKAINEGYAAAGSHLKLSGGYYMHPCGALYSKEIWHEASEYCDNIPYVYFPNMAMREGFACHLMIHRSIINSVLANPEDYIELSNGYKGLSANAMYAKANHYKPVVAPFHNGMGSDNESVRTYGQRTIESESRKTLLDGKRKLVHRIGEEPGQWLTYFLYANGKKVLSIPTEIKWLFNKENQQQEYTKTENGLTHIWAGSSFLDMKDTDMHDVYEFKKYQIEVLYNSLPEHQKIKP